MKKCPNCQKTFEDNMKFCQSDGTPLVVVAEDKPSDDPFKTMVASDIKPPVQETPRPEPPKPEPAMPEPPKPKPEPPAPKAPEPAPPADLSAVDTDDGDVLEIPEKEGSVDAMKTVVVKGKDTSDNIKVSDLPQEEAPKPTPPAPPAKPVTPAEPDFPGSEAATMITPEIPKFSEPDIKPPDLGGAGEMPKPPARKAPEAEKPVNPPPPPGAESMSSMPIPSPFGEEMPPGMSEPTDSPFGAPDTTPEPEVAAPKAATPPASPFAEPEDPFGTSALDDSGALSPEVSPVAMTPSDPSPFGSNSILDPGSPTSTDAEGENKTLAIVSLVSGILSVLCCFSIITGPAALITGFMARSKISQDPSVYGGGTFALIGMILGVLGTILFVIILALQLLGSLGSF